VTDLATGLGMPVCLDRGFGLQGRFLPGFIIFYLDFTFGLLILEFICVASVSLVTILMRERGRVVFIV